MNIKDHPFFRVLDMAEAHEKMGAKWGMNRKTDKRKFFAALKQAHPFLFTKKVTFEKRFEGRGAIDVENAAEEFSLPFGNSLYLLTDAPPIVGPMWAGGPSVPHQTLGYLIQELDVERFLVWQVGTIEYEGRKAPSVEQFEIDLKRFAHVKHDPEAGTVTIWSTEGNMEYIPDDSVEMHYVKEMCVLIQMTKAISVQRIGKEKLQSWSIKSRGVGQLGFTSIKTPNLYHIADKVEYEYLKSENSEINWEFSGWWKGHWRAFYVKDSQGNNVKTPSGHNIVDRKRIGKNRQGKYVKEGYTWVVEHIKGDPALAEIKTHIVTARR